MPARSGTSSASMHTATSFSSSFLGSSPSRQSPNRKGRHTPRGSIYDPFDSPSRRLAAEYNLCLSISDHKFNEKLDKAAAERAKIYGEKLARAEEEHKRVFKSAELEIERINLETEQNRLQKELLLQIENERLNHEKREREAEISQRMLEEAKREDAAAQKQLDRLKEIGETKRSQALKVQEAAAQKQRQEAEHKAHEAAAAAAQAQAQQAPRPQVSQAAPAPAAAPTATISAAKASAQSAGSDVEDIHDQYIALHARMKQFRVAFANEHKQPGNPLKAAVGDTRRNVRLRLGQINTDRKDSVAAIRKLREDSFNIALETPGPTVDIRPYLISQKIPPLANEAEAQYPAFLLYIWICFEKFVLKQFEKEAAGADGRTIQEIGLIAASLLADQKYMWKGIPLTDIVLAKLHRLCPILFGVRGTMDTVKGRVRLGWIPSDEQYGQRMRGLGAGYAALSLRAFTSKAPAIPMSDYWRAVVLICNTPPEHMWPGHYALLYGLIRDYYKKFLSIYGHQAKGVLRRATIDVPARAPPRCKDAAGTVAVLSLGWKKAGFSLD